MKYINGNYQDFKDQTKKALKHKMREHPIISNYLEKMNVLQTKVDKFKEIQSISGEQK